MHVLLNVPASVGCLTATLEGLTALDAVILQRRNVLPLYESGIRYRVEQRMKIPELGGRPLEIWENANEVYELGYADCDALASLRAAELRRDGEPAIAFAVRTGPKMFHALVRRADGRTEDPSRILGMGRR